jgi:hypothetical protein
VRDGFAEDFTLSA